MIRPENIEAEIARILEALEKATEQYGVVVEQAGEAKEAMDSAHARAFIQAKATPDPLTFKPRSDTLANKIADLDTEKLRKEFGGLEARARRLREHLTTYRNSLDALRTLSASTRELVK